MKYPDTQLFIDGQWMEANSGKALPVFNPATGHQIGHVAHAGLVDLDRALAAAQKGFETWRDMTPASRSPILRLAATLLRERSGNIAQLITMEQGKPVSEALSEVLAAADIIEWFAEEGFRVYGRIVPSRSSHSIRQMVLKDPVGPVAAFSPWNFPINQVVRKVAPALAAGCSILVKAPEETPASPAALIQAFVDAGIPPGVLGLVYGDPSQISEHLISHPVIRKVTFTGYTAVGKKLASLAGAHMKRVTMELGGHAPVIVCEDADIVLAAGISAKAKFRNAGQVCISPTRFLVHESVINQFSSALCEAISKFKVGDGLDPAVQMGPLANTRRLEAMKRLTDEAIQSGASLRLGGKAIGREGNFWLPTVLEDVPTHAQVFNEEPFGPIAALQKYSRLEDAISESNRLNYGLAGYAFTGSLKNADLISRKVEVGMMWINQAASGSAELPFGGLKDSGYGSEGGPEAVEAYLNVRAVSVTHH